MKTVFELIEANGLTLHGDIEHFAELVRAEAQRTFVPDAMTHDEGETVQYVAGWNDCRELMLRTRNPK